MFITVFRRQQDGTIKIHNGGYYAHAQVLNAYNCCLTVCRGQQDGTIKIFTMADIMLMRKF